MKTNEKIKKGLNYSIKDGIAWSVNDGLGSSYVSPYMINVLKASDAQIGLLTSVPSLVANISQVGSPKLMEKTSRKKLVTILVLLQAIMWLPILSVAFLVSSSILDILLAPFLVIIFYTLYLMFGGLAGPAWSSWMGDLVPEKERGRFFGRRNEIIGFAGLISMLLAGFFLDVFKMSSLLFGFATIFFIALVARLFSRHFLIHQYEPKFKEEEKYYFSLSQFVRQIWQRGNRANNFGRFTLYVTLISFAVNWAALFSPCTCSGI
jgi:MFS family permease